jgi:hypothetical protein
VNEKNIGIKLEVKILLAACLKKNRWFALLKL